MAKQKQTESDDSLAELAREIFVQKVSIRSSGISLEHLAAESFDAAAAFVRVANERPNTGQSEKG